jgi:hypothetical protein
MLKDLKVFGGDKYNLENLNIRVKTDIPLNGSEEAWG